MARVIPPITGEALLTLSTAAQQRRRVWVRYRGVDPYGVVFHFGRWYLVGFDHRSGEIRDFRIDRVLEVVPRDEAFQRPPDHDPEEAPGGVILRTQADDLRTATRYLVGMEWDFSVHRPPELLQEVRRLGAELLEMAGPLC
jgi:predicted DNA-binding transcriptional regulator YafY